MLHLETIELVNDGTGLGFGIVGGKTSGVIVKTILPGGIADQVTPAQQQEMGKKTRLNAASSGELVQMMVTMVAAFGGGGGLLSYQDGRLRSGDHILRIGDTDLLGMGSEQVAQVLRQCGNRVRLVVTRGPADEGPSGSAVMPVMLPTVSEQQVKHQGLFFSPSGYGSCRC